MFVQYSLFIPLNFIKSLKYFYSRARLVMNVCDFLITSQLQLLYAENKSHNKFRSPNISRALLITTKNEFWRYISQYSFIKRYWFNSILDRVSKVINLSLMTFTKEDILSFNIEIDNIIYIKVFHAATNINSYLIYYIF